MSTAPAPLIAVDGLTKHYRAGSGLLAAMAKDGPLVRAVDGISFSLNRGESVGLLGESGCGKTTTGRLLLKLTEPSAGTIAYEGQPLSALAGPALRTFRRHAQLIFQNPFDALNPRFTIARCLNEPLINAGVPRSERAAFIERALDLALSAVYISHDLSLVRYLCERTIVMYLGRIVEDAPTAALIDRPLHPYTQALVAAVPTPDPNQSRAPLPIGATPPDGRHPTIGCRFADRCPKVMEKCRRIDPPAFTVDGRSVACHLYGETS